MGTSSGLREEQDRRASSLRERPPQHLDRGSDVDRYYRMGSCLSVGGAARSGVGDSDAYVHACVRPWAVGPVGT